MAKTHIVKLGNEEIPVTIETLGNLFPENSEAGEVPELNPCIVTCCKVPTADIEPCNDAPVTPTPITPAPQPDIPFSLLAALLPSESPCPNRGACPDIRVITKPEDITDGLCVSEPSDETYNEVEVGFVMRPCRDESTQNSEEETDVGETVFSDSLVDNGRIQTPVALKGRITMDLDIETHCADDEAYPSNTILVRPHIRWESITDFPVFEVNPEMVPLSEIPADNQYETEVIIPIEKVSVTTDVHTEVPLYGKLIYGIKKECTSDAEQGSVTLNLGAGVGFPSPDGGSSGGDGDEGDGGDGGDSGDGGDGGSGGDGGDDGDVIIIPDIDGLTTDVNVVQNITVESGRFYRSTVTLKFIHGVLAEVTEPVRTDITPHYLTDVVFDSETCELTVEDIEAAPEETPPAET